VPHDRLSTDHLRLRDAATGQHQIPFFSPVDIADCQGEFFVMKVWNALRHPDRLFAVVVIIAAVIMYGLSGSLAPPDSPGGISASSYPKFILICVILLSGFVILRSSVSVPSNTPASSRGVQIVILSALYIVSIEPVGFFLVTPVFLFVLPLLVGFRNYRLNAISVIISTGLVYLVFVRTLAIPLPPGLLGD